MAGCTQPLNAANSCLHNRTNRVNIDLVYDDVQKELQCEVQVVNGVSAMLSRALEQVVEQIRLNRSSAYHLSADLKDKDTTLGVDSEALSKNNSNIANEIEAKLSELCLARQTSNVPKIKSSWTTPGDWQAYSEQGIAKAEEELQHSLRLRAAVDEIMTAGTEDLRKQKVATDNALRQRIEDVTLAKSLEGRQVTELSQLVKNHEIHRSFAKVHSRPSPHRQPRKRAPSCQHPNRLHPRPNHPNRIRHRRQKRP